MKIVPVHGAAGFVPRPRFFEGEQSEEDQNCDSYKQAQKEESGKFKMSIVLLSQMKEGEQQLQT